MIDLRCGDCLEVMKSIPAESVDLIVTDPPYGIGFQSHRRKDLYATIQNDENLDWLNTYMLECHRIMRQNTAIYCFCSWHNVDVFKHAIEQVFKLKNIIVWQKNNHGSGDLKAGYAPKHEFIIYANKGRKILNGKRMEDIISANKTGNKLHPTQKPVDLLSTFITNSSQEDDVVFDGFMGSGSTGVACVRTNRNFIGIELDEQYFNVAKERIEHEEN